MYSISLSSLHLCTYFIIYLSIPLFYLCCTLALTPIFSPISIPLRHYVCLLCAGEDAIGHWRRVLGPTRVSEARQEAPGSLRARFGSPHNDSHNAAHGSDSVNSAHREIKFFFPDCEYMQSDTSVVLCSSLEIYASPSCQTMASPDSPYDMAIIHD